MQSFLRLKKDAIMTVSLIITAAGNSSRMCGEDKIFAILSGKPIIVHTLNCFKSYDFFNQIILVVNKNNLTKTKNIIQGLKIQIPITICAGGATRQESVKLGMKKIKKADFVVIHDGARPIVEKTIITNGMKYVKKSGAAIPTIPITETIKLIEKNHPIKTLPRENIHIVQTPQFFKFDILKKAQKIVQNLFTDESSLVEQINITPTIFPGSKKNIKITEKQDLELAKYYLKKDNIND